MHHSRVRLSRTNVLSFFRALLFASALLCSGAGWAAAAQSVAFVGAQSNIPVTGLGNIKDVAVDSKGNVFIADLSTATIVEVPRTATGYGAQITLPITGLEGPCGVVVDKAGNLIIADTYNPGEGRVLLLPKTDKGYGPQTVLPTQGLFLPYKLAFDRAGNLFVVDFSGFVIELPATDAGYGAQISVPFENVHHDIFGGIAVDGAGDIFVTDFDAGKVLELPKTEAGYGDQIVLADALTHPRGLSVNRAGDLFIADDEASKIKELHLSSGTYEPLRTLPIKRLSYPDTVSLDRDENLFVANTGHKTIVELQRRAVDFGSAFLCASGQETPAPCSNTLTLNFRAHTDVTLGTPVVLTSGSQHDDFSIAGASTCTGAFAAGGSCTVAVTFAPQDAGLVKGAIQIVDGSGTVVATTSLSGSGIAISGGAPEAQLSATYLKFGTVILGESYVLPLTITNIGGETLTVTTSTTGGNYSVASGTCAAGAGAGQSCVLQVQFTPTTISAHYGTLTVHTNAGDFLIKLAGAAVGLRVNNGSSLHFGTVASGSAKVLPLTVTNMGIPGKIKFGTNITVRATAHPTTTFTILTTPQNTCVAGIAPGESCTLPVQFSPTSSGIHADLLTLTPTQSPGTVTAWLVGTTP